MPILATCNCGAQYQLKDEFAGRAVRCKSCGATFTALATAAPAQQAQADAVFDRDKFLLRQKMMSLSQKYTVSNEQSQPIVFVVRPAHIGRSLLAGLGAVVAFAVGVAVVVAPVALLNEQILQHETGMFVFFGGFVLGMIAAVAMAVILSLKRHVLFYRDESRTDKLIDVLQDKKIHIIVATFTLRSATGEVIAKFRKNYLHNFIRRKWQVIAPSGEVICTVKEDSIILSILRRFLGPLFYSLLRTNFIFCRQESDEIIGEFNRKFTLFDRYVLDMSSDPTRSLDRRIALAMGVMLDTGERR